MATSSKELSLGSLAPDFSLPDVARGGVVSRDDVAGGHPFLVVFLCRHCPYVKHVEAELARLGKDYAGRVGMVGICANDAAEYPDDAPSSLAEQARSAGFLFPYLHDASQSVARAFGAVCTPEFFIFDQTRALAYHGRLDASRPGRGTADGADLRAALDAVLAGRSPSGEQHAAMGCSIKWRH